MYPRPCHCTHLDLSSSRPYPDHCPPVHPPQVSLQGSAHPHVIEEYLIFLVLVVTLLEAPPTEDGEPVPNHSRRVGKAWWRQRARLLDRRPVQLPGVQHLPQTIRSRRDAGEMRARDAGETRARRRRDVNEMRARRGRDAGEMRARCGRDAGETRARRGRNAGDAGKARQDARLGSALCA